MSEIFCNKLKAEASQLASPPLPGKLGQRIYENISAQVWNEWLEFKTKVINEYEFDLSDPKDRNELDRQMFAFLNFEEGKGTKLYEVADE